MMNATATTRRCAALAAVDGARGTARRCAAAAEEASDHCAPHAERLGAEVRRYKAEQAGLCEGAGLRWAAIDGWIGAQDDAGRLLRAARGLARVARMRFAVGVAYFYGPPSRYGAEAELAGSLARLGLAGLAWPDPVVAADEAHAFAVTRSLRLARAARERAAASARPAAPPARPAAPPVVEDDEDEEPLSYMVPDEAAPAPPRARPVGNRGAAVPPPREWTEWERALYDAYWTWLRRVAPQMPADNIGRKVHWELTALLDKVRAALALPEARGNGAVANPGAVVEAVEQLGAPYSRLFSADLCYRQVVIAAHNAVTQCDAAVVDDPTGHGSLVPFMTGVCLDLHHLCTRVANEQKRPRKGRAHGVAGAVAARRCAETLLACVRELPFVYRAALGHAMALSRDYGAVCIAAACCGLSPAEDPGGLAFAARFDRDPAAVFAEVLAACWSSAVAASVEVDLSPQHAAVLARHDRAVEEARRRTAGRSSSREALRVECRIAITPQRKAEVAAAAAASLDDQLRRALARVCA